MKIGDRVKVIESHRSDFEGMIGKLVEIKGEDLKYRIVISKHFDLWARKIVKVSLCLNCHKETETIHNNTGENRKCKECEKDKERWNGVEWIQK